MKFSDYQKQAITTDLFTKPLKPELFSVGFLEKVLGITGEAGELADKIKKILRDQDGKLMTSDTEKIVQELGDLLWYISAVASYLDVPLEQVAKMNLDKLSSRKTRGVIKGAGDNR